MGSGTESAEPLGGATEGGTVYVAAIGGGIVGIAVIAIIAGLLLGKKRKTDEKIGGPTGDGRSPFSASGNV